MTNFIAEIGGRTRGQLLNKYTDIIELFRNDDFRKEEGRGSEFHDMFSGEYEGLRRHLTFPDVGKSNV